MNVTTLISHWHLRVVQKAKGYLVLKPSNRILRSLKLYKVVKTSVISGTGACFDDIDNVMTSLFVSADNSARYWRTLRETVIGSDFLLIMIDLLLMSLIRSVLTTVRQDSSVMTSRRTGHRAPWLCGLCRWRCVHSRDAAETWCSESWSMSVCWPEKALTIPSEISF